MPVGGEVLEFNEQLSEDGGDNPGLLNEDPYGEGWIVKVSLSNPDDLKGLMSAADYQELVS